MYWFPLWDFKQVISLFSSIRNIPVITLNWEWRSFAFIFLIPHLFTEVGRRHGRDCEICAFSRVRCGKGAHRTIRRCPPALHASAQAHPGEPVLRGGHSGGRPGTPREAGSGSGLCSIWSQLSCDEVQSALFPPFAWILPVPLGPSVLLNYFEQLFHLLIERNVALMLKACTITLTSNSESQMLAFNSYKNVSLKKTTRSTAQNKRVKWGHSTLERASVRASETSV